MNPQSAPQPDHHSATFSILAAELPGDAPVNAGILLLDSERDQLYIRMRRDWDSFAGEEAEVLAELEADLDLKAREMGGARLLESMEDSLSNLLRISAREQVMVDDFDRALARLYRRHVKSNVIEFVTHLPRYSLAAAAGRFLENSEIEAEGWEEAPPDLKVTEEMFVAHIAGRSMEPKIPDGSLCIFKGGMIGGSRQGRLVLVERLGGGTNERYAVKRYRSEKRIEIGAWRHEMIVLESLNPEFESWELNPEEDRYRIVGEFVRVLD